MSDDFYILDADALDALTELVNIGVGRAAASLSDLIAQRIELDVPRVRLCRGDGPAFHDNTNFDASTTVVTQDFHGQIQGRAALVFPQASALILAQLLAGTGTTATEVDAELAGVLLEVGNIVLNGVLGSLSNVATDAFDYSLPTLFDDHPALSKVLSFHNANTELLIADVEFRVQHSEIRGTIAVVFAGGCVELLLQQAMQSV